MTRRMQVCLALLGGIALGAQAQVSIAPSTSSTSSAPAQVTAGKVYTVPAGTKVLLSLRHEISTRTAKTGDPVFFTSDFPVVQNGVVVIPPGVYVKGYINSVQRAGKVKGRAQIQLHFSSFIFPNGAEVAIPGITDSVPGSTGAKVKNGEGTIEQSGSKGKDAQAITNSTLTGAGVGALAGWGAGNAATGMGIGAGAGGAFGVISTLMKRGDDIVIPQGSTVEMSLERPLQIEQQVVEAPPANKTAVQQFAPVTAQQAPMQK